MSGMADEEGREAPTSAGRPDGAPRTAVAVGLGSNLGDRASHLAAAVEGLGGDLSALRCSRVYETEPVGVGEDHPPYLNLCCVGRTALDAASLLAKLQQIEAAAGRTRAGRDAKAPRTLDVDLLLYGHEEIRRPGLRVPHPRMRRRAFVLLPLAELAGTWRDPETGRTVAELADAIDGSGVEPYGGGVPPELERVIDA